MFLIDIPEPKNCDDCLFCDYERGFCYFSTTDGTLKTTKSVIEYAKNCTKPDWCPASKKFEEVYVITSGEYSDYGINAVTISKERAEKLKKYYSNQLYSSSPVEIETYNIDEPHEDLDDLIPIYYVSIDRCGKCFCRRETWMHEKTGKLINEAPSYLASYLGGELITKQHGLIGDDFLSFRWYGAAKDEEHALKIAQDKRAKMLEKYYIDKGGKQMSFAYDQYLAEHIGNVNKGLHWMLDNLGFKEERPELEIALVNFDHDESKYSVEEYDAYDQYFYGGNRSYKVVQEFNYAWLHHIHNNPHHWQYWVLLEDDPESGLPYKALEIPVHVIFEMIADWWSFSWKSGNLFEIFNWYADHRSKQIINPKSREIVEYILDRIWKVLIMQETVAGHDISEIEKQYRRFWAEQDADLLNWDHPSARVIGKVVDMNETENGLEVTVEHSESEEDEDLYGVPELKKFPMPDKKHVKSAIRFFNYIDPKYEKELAEAILEKAEEFGLDLESDISVGDENRLKKYLPEKKEES